MNKRERKRAAKIEILRRLQRQTFNGGIETFGETEAAKVVDEIFAYIAKLEARCKQKRKPPK
jgi:hypothetical protein